ncbi:fibronectin type 3 and ankyrin repeat domains protein 1-like [Haliotis asinina]|uniref:fibronectin type 3 and ankyrin repeat domains protein 1-like n=1 Tax=Haliotis asinina TaxID=109174 RepID=UPI00353211AD
MKEKRWGKIRRDILLHQDNAPVHTSRVAAAAVQECGYEILPHPPYSPDLAPSDYHLFPHLKKHLRGRRFQDDNELIAATEASFEDQNGAFYRHGTSDWQKRWNNCLDSQTSHDPSQKYMVSPAPVTTQDLQTTPSAAAGRDLYDDSSRGDLERVKRILAAGHVNINYRGQNSMTPVMAAAESGHSDVVEFLVGRGADVSLVDRRGSNVLHFASKRGDLEIVKLILDLNVVDFNTRTNYGWTAADYARLWGHQRVVDLLVSRGAH